MAGENVFSIVLSYELDNDSRIAKRVWIRIEDGVVIQKNYLIVARFTNFMRNCSQHFRIYKTVVFIELTGVEANQKNWHTINHDVFKKVDIRKMFLYAIDITIKKNIILTAIFTI